MIAKANNKQQVMAVLQLTRTGDIVQTTQALEGFREANPNIRLILIARKQYGKPVQFLTEKVFDRVYYIDQVAITNPPLNNISLEDSRKIFREQLSVINDEGINVLLNLSFSKTSSYLAPLIKATHRLGQTRSENDELVIGDQWSQFIYSNVMGTELTPFNLVDLFRKIAGHKEVPAKYTAHLTEAREITNIVMHPFASIQKKQWNANKWSSLVLSVLRDNPDVTISLVGGKTDIKKSEEILSSPYLDRYSNRIRNNTGQTKIEDVFNSFNSNTLFIGHDSLISHLASYKRVPAIVVSLGTVRPYETTSYGHGNISVSPRTGCFPCPVADSCSDFSCHKDLSEKIVGTIANAKINNIPVTTQYLQENCSDLLLSKVYVYQTQMVEGLGQHLEDLSGNNPSDTDVMRTLYTIMWNFVLSNVDVNSTIPIITQSVSHKLKNYFQGLSSLYELNEFGVTYSDYILKEIQSPSPALERIKEFGLKLNEIDQLQLVMSKTFPMLKPIINHFHVKKALMAGKGVHELAQSSLLTYHDANNAVSAMYDLMQNCFDLNGLVMNKANSEHNQVVNNN